VLNTNSDNMEDIFKTLSKKHKEDIIFIEKQMKLFEALTQKRMELIKAVIDRQPHSIRELASVVNRDVKNVFDDLKLLNKMRIVRLIKTGRCVTPRVRKKIIIVNLS